MTTQGKPSFSHLGLHVNDLEVMAKFYTELFALQITDRGPLAIPGNPNIVFLSSNADEHHQIALVEGRRDGGISGGVLHQISFRVDGLPGLRRLKVAAEELGVTEFMPLNHGNAWSLYFADPEGNTIEAFATSPWHVRQPVTDALDFDDSDEEIRAKTEARYASTPDFEPMEAWRAAFAERLARR